MEQGGAQAFILGKNSGPEPFAVEGVADTLDAYAHIAIIQGQTIPVIIVAAPMHQPPDSPVLLIIQADGVIGHAHPSAGWVRREAPGQCSA